MMKRSLPLFLLSAGLLGCPTQETPPGADLTVAVSDMATPDQATPGGPIAKRPSKSSTIAIADDDSVVMMSSPEGGVVATFDAQGARLAQVKTGSEPFAVVIHPDNKSAYVSNRGDSTVVKLTNLTSANPTVSPAVKVGSEPTGLALSPSGARLFVAEWAESRISVIDTTTMAVVGTITGVRNPRAIAVTNNGDSRDSDELLVVPEFFGDPQAGGEAKDDGRKGVVRLFSVSDLSAQGVISLNPLTAAETGFGVGTAPNQLVAAAVRGQKVYIPSVSASPQGPPKFDNNVSPVVYVVDLASKAELKTANAGTVSLAAQVAKALPDPLPAGVSRHFLADLRDVDFVPGTNIAYFVSQGADVVQRVRFDDAGALVEFGSTMNKQIDIAGDANLGVCQNPNGIVIANNSQRAFVNCWVSRRLGIVDLTAQKLDKTVEAAAIPAADQAAARGRRFYFTARGRWSNQSWSSCGSCHPDGLTDNITWIFGAGPRQTTSMDGSYSHGALAQKQRIFNWTAVNDEMHDFEGNTRGTSGGLGAITTAPLQGDCGTLAKESRVGTDANGTLPGGLGSPTAKELQDGLGLPAGVRCVKDFDDMDLYVRTIRPPRGRTGLDAASVARGAALFANATSGCARCHGGAGFTVSRRFYTPATARNTTLTTTAFTKPAAWPASYTKHSTFQVAAQPITAEVAPFNAAVIAPPQLACAIRDVGTFGILNNTAATDALEIKAAGVSPANRAQGRGGYNVPSLYGLALGAPYLHHGQARTLDDLFSNANFVTHTQAGAANFLTGGTAPQDRADLINYLLSIDATTTEVTVTAGFDTGCL